VPYWPNPVWGSDVIFPNNFGEDLFTLRDVRCLRTFVNIAFVVRIASLASRVLDARQLALCAVQSATNVFVACLALSDLALCVFSLPVQLHYQLTNTWYFGHALCRVVFAAFAVPMHLSTCTIMFIALDRSDAVIDTILCYQYDSTVKG